MYAKLDIGDFLEVKAKWDESQHPRVSAGHGDPSGEFTESATSKVGEVGSDDFKKIVNSAYKDANKRMAGFSDEWKDFISDQSLDDHVQSWQDSDQLTTTVYHAANIISGKGYIPAPQELRGMDYVYSGDKDFDDPMDVAAYGTAAVLLRESGKRKISAPVLERYIFAKASEQEVGGRGGSGSVSDPLLKAKVGEVYNFPLTAFTTNKMSEGAILVKDQIFNLKGDKRQQKIIRFEKPATGFNISKHGYGEVETGEVLVTGRVKVKSIKKVKVPVYDRDMTPSGFETREVITVARV